MSQKTHPRAVGVFVLGAIALVLAAIVLLSSGNWFEPKSMFTVFFPGSVRGLNKGAAVTFRGVKIGEVKDVTAFLTGQDQPPIQIEVVIEIRTNVVEVPEGVARPFAGADPDSLARGLIERGVRARMMSQSMLTGQKYIDLDFLPKEPARLAGLRRNYPELPTTPTAMERLEDRADDFFDKLADLPLDQALEDLRKALQSLRERAVLARSRGHARRHAPREPRARAGDRGRAPGDRRRAQDCCRTSTRTSTASAATRDARSTRRARRSRPRARRSSRSSARSPAPTRCASSRPRRSRSCRAR